MKTLRVRSIKALLKNDDFVVRPVSGVSMMPMLNEHTDAVKLVAPNRNIEIGDVVMYKSGCRLCTLHRVCRIDGDTLIIRGDNCISFERVKKKNIIALMDGYIKNGTYIPNGDKDYREYVKEVLAAGKPLIPKEWRYVPQLYRAAITGGDVPPAPCGIDWNEIVSLCNKQQIASAVATVMPKLRPAPPADVLDAFSKAFGLALKRTLLFGAERTKILNELDREHIRFLPLKGIVIEPLYPKTGMREFADNDILYDKARQSDIVRIMTSLGYETKSLNGVHDIFYKKPIFNFEMHRALFADDTRFADFFSDILDRVAGGDTGNRMSDEDFYLYFLAHYAKHHEKSGSGLRPLGDLFLLKSHIDETPAFDRRYVDASLVKLGLVEFEKQMLSVSDNLFINGKIDDDTLKHIMPESTYGSSRTQTDIGIRKKGRLGYLLSRMLLPYRKMKTVFPILNSLPFLLPVCWVIRLVKAAANPKKRKTAKRELRAVTQRHVK